MAGSDEAPGSRGVLGEERPVDLFAEQQGLGRLQQRLFDKPRELQRLSRYILLDRIGAGGLGILFAAYDPELDRKVAIKILHTDVADDEGARLARARLQREAQAIAQLSHPNVVTVYDVGTYDIADLLISRPADEPSRAEPRVFVVMELIDGVDLGEWLGTRKRSWREVAAAFIAAGRGLEAAHAAGIIHRDIKPSNVLVGEDGRVRVLDFGLAQAVTADAPLPTQEDPPPTDVPVPASSLGTPITHVGTVMGTPAYMAPEQHRGAAMDERTDQYNFCVALYEALYGRLPFTGDTMIELLGAKESMRPSIPAGRDVPNWLARSVTRGLHADASRRYPSMSVLLAALERDPRRRRRWWFVLGGVAVVAAAGTLAHPSSTDRAGACEAEAQGITQVWTPATKAAIHDGFAATRLPYAEAAWASVEARLDRYALSWADARTEACEATVVRREQAPETLALRRRCLDRRLVRLSQLIEALHEGDADVVEHAVAAVDRLPAVIECADVEALQVGDLPVDPVLAEALEPIEGQILRANALKDLGKYVRADQLARTTLTKARRLGHRPTESRLLLLLGQVADLLGDEGSAEALVLEALVAAEQVAYHEGATRSLLELVRLLGEQPTRVGEAERLERHAAAKLSYRGLGEEVEASFAEVRGVVSAARGDFEQALELHRSALALREDYLGLEHLDSLRSVEAVALALLEQGRLEEADAYLGQGIELAESSLGNAHPRVAGFATQLSRVALLQGRDADALEHGRRALSITERTAGPVHPHTGARVSDLGTVLSHAGRLEESLAYHRRALAVRERVRERDHVEVADSLIDAGVVLMMLGRFGQAVAPIERALGIRGRQLGPGHPDVGRAASQLGEALLGSGRPEAARPLFEQGLTVLETAHGSGAAAAVGPLRGLGLAHAAVGNRAAALAALERAVEAAEQGDTTRAELAATRFALARTLPRSDRSRAVALARLASATYEGVDVKARRQVEAWLAGHRP